MSSSNMEDTSLASRTTTTRDIKVISLGAPRVGKVSLNALISHVKIVHCFYFSKELFDKTILRKAIRIKIHGHTRNRLWSHHVCYIVLNQSLHICTCRVHIKGHKIKVNIFDVGGEPFFYEVLTNLYWLHSSL